MVLLQRFGLLAIILASTVVSAPAQQNSKNPVFQDPEIDKNLPNVLLIGDSISIGYTLATRETLAGVANVFRPKTNCGPTTKGMEEIENWIGNRKWDVIHWNFGLHDLKYMGPNRENLADPNSPTSKPQVPIEQYAANIKTLAKRLKETGAKVIWRETTPVPEGAKGRVVGDSAKYNQAAAKVIAEVGGIQTDPFFAYAESVKEHQRAANVHYTQEGSLLLGEHVADVIKKALSE